MREKRIMIISSPFSNPTVYIFFGVDTNPTISVTLKQKDLYEFISGHVDGTTADIRIKGMKMYNKKIQKELREYLITKNSYNSCPIELI